MNIFVFLLISVAVISITIVYSIKRYSVKNLANKFEEEFDEIKDRYETEVKRILERVDEQFKTQEDKFLSIKKDLDKMEKQRQSTKKNIIEYQASIEKLNKEFDGINKRVNENKIKLTKKGIFPIISDHKKIEVILGRISEINKIMKISPDFRHDNKEICSTLNSKDDKTIGYLSHFMTEKLDCFISDCIYLADDINEKTVHTPGYSYNGCIKALKRLHKEYQQKKQNVLDDCGVFYEDEDDYQHYSDITSKWYLKNKPKMPASWNDAMEARNKLYSYYKDRFGRDFDCFKSQLIPLLYNVILDHLLIRDHKPELK